MFGVSDSTIIFLLLETVFSGGVWKNRIGGGGALRRFFLVSEEERFQDALFWNKLLRVGLHLFVCKKSSLCVFGSSCFCW